VQAHTLHSQLFGFLYFVGASVTYIVVLLALRLECKIEELTFYGGFYPSLMLFCPRC